MNNFINNILRNVINAYKTKSFGFALWGVFVFGSILIGFVGRIYAEIVRYLDIPSYITFPFGFISLWGYISIAYLIFSIIYLYQKSDLLSLKRNKMVGLFLGVYMCSGLIVFGLMGNFSVLFIIGSAVYDLMTGNFLVIAYLPVVSEISQNILRCASKISNY